MIPQVSSAASRLRSTAATTAPSRANWTAVAFPFPHPGPTEPAPKTIAIFPSRRPGNVFLLLRSPDRAGRNLGARPAIDPPAQGILYPHPDLQTGIRSFRVHV